MRIRFSLRTLLIGMGVIAIAVWLGNWALTRVRSQQAISYLESRHILRGYFEEGDDWAIELVEDTREPMSATDWQQLGRLGRIWEIVAIGDEVPSAELCELVRQNKRSITSLHFRHCRLSPELAAAISECSRLESLKFIDVTEGSQPFRVASLPNLRDLAIWNSDVGDASLAWIAQQRELEVLVIRNNSRATTSIVDGLLRCKSLREVYLPGTAVSNDGMRRLLANLDLEQIGFPAVTLSESDVAAMVASKLTHIDLRHVDLSASVAPLVKCERVFWLDISFAHFQLLASSRAEFFRKNRLILNVYGLGRYEDVPPDFFPPPFELQRCGRTGAKLFDPATGPGMPVPASN